jgi:hypothetical protein
MNPDSRPVLPDPPAARPAGDALPLSPAPRRRPLRAALVVCLGITAVSFLLAYVVSLAEEPVKLVKAPSPSYAPTVITRDVLSAKVSVAAFYMGRGQLSGARKTLDDMLAHSGCGYVTSGGGAFKTQRHAIRVARLWTSSVYNAEASGAPSGYHIVIGTGLAKAESIAAVKTVFQTVQGPWVSLGVALYCPDVT